MVFESSWLLIQLTQSQAQLVGNLNEGFLFLMNLDLLVNDMVPVLLYFGVILVLVLDLFALLLSLRLIRLT